MHGRAGGPLTLTRVVPFMLDNYPQASGKSSVAPTCAVQRKYLPMTRLRAAPAASINASSEQEAPIERGRSEREALRCSRCPVWGIWR
eukprot:8128552-Alexandrium_andersonii.AAC.1